MPKIEGLQAEISRAASFQFKLDPDRIPWIYAALNHTSQVELYNGPFPEPFTELSYIAALQQGQVGLAAFFGLGANFIDRYGDGIGSPDDLETLLKRYQKHEFTPGMQRLIVTQDNQVHGMIARMDKERIIIQSGGGVGQLNLDENEPSNSLAVYLARFNLLVQRYVSSLWRTSPETSQERFALVLGIPALPAGAPKTYFSTFEIVGRRFLERPRPVDLNDDIGGNRFLKTAIRAIVVDQTHPEVSRAHGTQPFSNRFILITGPEGTGKSLFPKALDKILRELYGDGLENYRLPLADMITQYGPGTVDVVSTVLNHIRENEKNGVPTILQLDSLEWLIPPHQRGENNLQPPSTAEFNYLLRTLNPLYMVLREFGTSMGPSSQNVIVLGESRAPRVNLPEAISKTFRNAFPLDHPTLDDYADILRVQIRVIKGFALKSNIDPFAPDIESTLPSIAPSAVGLTGKDLRQAFDDIANRHKAEFDGENYIPTTDTDIKDELKRLQLAKGIEVRLENPLGFLGHVSR